MAPLVVTSVTLGLLWVGAENVQESVAPESEIKDMAADYMLTAFKARKHSERPTVFTLWESACALSWREYLEENLGVRTLCISRDDLKDQNVSLLGDLINLP